MVTLFSIVLIDVDEPTKIVITYVDNTAKRWMVPRTGNKGTIEFNFDGEPQDQVKMIKIIYAGSGVLGPIKYVTVSKYCLVNEFRALIFLFLYSLVLLCRYCWCRPLNCLRVLRVVPDGDENDAILKDNNPPVTNIHASVLLARTPTAAGMKNVLPGKSGGGIRSRPLSTFVGGEAQQEMGWAVVEQEFGVSKKGVAALRERFQENIEKILIDAFSGQCTPGHSCREATKRALGFLLDQERLSNQNDKQEEEVHKSNQKDKQEEVY